MEKFGTCRFCLGSGVSQLTKTVCGMCQLGYSGDALYWEQRMTYDPKRNRLKLTPKAALDRAVEAIRKIKP